MHVYFIFSFELGLEGGGVVFYFEDSARKRLPNSEYFDTGGGNGG